MRVPPRVGRYMALSRVSAWESSISRRLEERWLRIEVPQGKHTAEFDDVPSTLGRYQVRRGAVGANQGDSSCLGGQ